MNCFPFPLPKMSPEWFQKSYNLEGSSQTVYKIKYFGLEFSLIITQLDSISRNHPYSEELLTMGTNFKRLFMFPNGPGFWQSQPL